MGKNIVVCCDGTAGEYGERKTNVVRLYSALSRDTHEQLAFYDPGVGTSPAPPTLSRPLRTLEQALGLAFGYGITRNIRDAYRFVMRTYRPGDQLYIFGFSRGAYAARALAGLIHKCGLLLPHNDNLVPYALKVFLRQPTGKVSNGFRKTFAQRCRIKFLGLWDTVSSIGCIYDPVTMPYTRENPSVDVVRHALSIHERRCFYRQNSFVAGAGQDVKEVWFAGCHRDIGGSYPDEESGLSQLSLAWMIEEAAAHGLRFDESRLSKILPARRPTRPGLPVPPDPEAEPHDSLRGAWWIPELLPRLYRDPRDGHRKKWKIPLAAMRYIPEGATIHASVLNARRARPTNLPARYIVERQIVSDPSSDHRLR